jgi:hypothetical protein
LTTTRNIEPRLSDDDVARAMALTEDSEGVEPKLTAPASDHRSALEALQKDPLDAQIRQGVPRQARPRTEQASGRRSRTPRAEEGRRLGREAPAGRALRAPEPAAVNGVRRRGRRDAGWVRLLRNPRAFDEVRAAQAFQLAAEWRAFLAGRGVDLGEQETKTRKALELFAKRLKTATADGPAG